METFCKEKHQGFLTDRKKAYGDGCLESKIFFRLFPLGHWRLVILFADKRVERQAGLEAKFSFIIMKWMLVEIAKWAGVLGRQSKERRC